MDGASIFVLVASGALAIYFSHLLVKALRTGIFESPQGWRTHRATHPRLFGFSVGLLIVLIAMCAAMIAMIAFKLHA